VEYVLQGLQKRNGVGFVSPGAKLKKCDLYMLLKATTERVHEFWLSKFSLDTFALKLLVTRFLKTWDKKGHNVFVVYGPGAF
jgi:hypothetical protein